VRIRCFPWNYVLGAASGPGKALATLRRLRLVEAFAPEAGASYGARAGGPFQSFASGCAQHNGDLVLLTMISGLTGVARYSRLVYK
jgi:hypothetical protein